MNKKLLIPVFIIGAVVVGYFLGVSNTSTNTQADTSAKKTVMSQSDEGGSSHSVIPGAQHIHAVTYDPDGNLLLGTHWQFIQEVNDGGKAWQKVSVKGSVNADDWMSLIVDPRNRKIMFAGGQRSRCHKKY